jgi:hypothetical protein
MDADAKISSVLKAHSLSAREYLVGVPILRMALFAAQGLNSSDVVASPANLAFAKAHLAELKPKLDRADRLGRQ